MIRLHYSCDGEAVTFSYDGHSETGFSYNHQKSQGISSLVLYSVYGSRGGTSFDVILGKMI